MSLAPAQLVARTRDYIASHWRGDQSLVRSFWVNLVLLRTLLFLLQQQLQPGDDENHAEHAVLIILLAIVAHGIVFVWQLVGAVRAAERELVESGSQAATWGVQLGCVVLFWLTLGYAIESWQMTQAQPEEERFAQRMERQRRERYTLSVDATATRLELRGTIELGVTRRVEALLQRTPTIERLILASAGGNVYEARGIARLLREHALASHVEDLCASACTVAFIGGGPRTMSRSARLGFHQYRLDDLRAMIVSDPAQAQRRDQAMYRDAGVEPAFVAQMFRHTADGMWWPSSAELLAAGVIDRVTAPD